MDDVFEKFVSEAIDNIPIGYQDKLKDVVFTIEEEPSPEQKRTLGLRDCDGLFGLYQGVPYTKRNGNNHLLLPDVITIFKHPMLDVFTDKDALRKQIHKTVWHEVAHYFGLGHDRIYAVESQLEQYAADDDQV